LDSVLVVPIPIDHLDRAWTHVHQYLDEALHHGTEITVDQLRLLIQMGRVDLLCAWRHERVIGAMAIEIIRYPQYAVAHVIALGGKGCADGVGMDQVRAYCRQRGVTKLQAFCRRSVARFLRRFRFYEAYTVVRSDI
jgi:hypothetical protein